MPLSEDDQRRLDEIEISLGIEPPVIAAEDAGESDEEES